MADKIKATHQDGTVSDGTVDTGNPHAKRPADKKQGDMNADTSAATDKGVVMPSGKVSEEEIKALFQSVEGLSEDFATRAHVLIEGALSERETAIRAALQEDFDSRIAAGLEEAVASYEEKIDSYMNYVVETWMTENALQVEQGIKNEIAEQVLESVAAIVEANGIALPEDKVDVAESLAEEVRETEKKLNEQIETNLALTKQIEKYQLAEAFAEVSADLSDVSKEKLQKLAENISYADVADYKARVSILKESVTEAKPAGKPAAEQLSESVTLAPQGDEFAGLTDRQKAYLIASRGFAK